VDLDNGVRAGGVKSFIFARIGREQTGHRPVPAKMMALRVGDGAERVKMTPGCARRPAHLRQLARLGGNAGVAARTRVGR